MKKSTIFVFWLYLLSVLGLTLTVIVCSIYDAPIVKFTRDPASIAEISPFHGLLSSIGVLLWCSTAVAALFSYFLLRKSGDKSEFKGFLLTGGLLTSMLLVDDYFMFHDWILPKLGIGEHAVFLFFALSIVIDSFPRSDRQMASSV